MPPSIPSKTPGVPLRGSHLLGDQLVGDEYFGPTVADH